ncbi:MAG: GatB/YqeY domain-containing protein, partial [Pseudomonadota bacterium]|nr:GatB/YqeY domain-containing protein [Pseudomonadota bacterium]
MLRDTLTGSMKDAMKAKDQITLSTLRLVNAAIKQQDIDVRASGNEDGIADSEILSLLQKMIKQRRESIRMYEEGGRADAAAQEAAEIEVIERFLPQMMSEAEVEAALDEVISETGAGSIKDMGPVMAALKQKYAGQID